MRVAPVVLGLISLACDERPAQGHELPGWIPVAHAQERATTRGKGEGSRAPERAAAPPRQSGDPAYSMPGALECLNQARSETFLGEGDAYLLCGGAESAAPLTCYQTADRDTFLPERLMFNLCRCAASNDPVTCYERVQQDTFLEDREIVQLCSAVNRRHLWPNCYPIAPNPY